MTAMTRVGDLPPQLKQALEELNQYIDTQHTIAQALESDSAKHNQLVELIPEDIRYLQNKFLATKQALNFDTNQLLTLKQQNNELTEDVSNIMQLIVQLQTPGLRLALLFQLNEFFVRKINKYRDILADYEKMVLEISTVLCGLEKLCTEGFGNVLSVVLVIRNQFQMFMELCEVMAQLHAEVLRIAK